MATPTHGATGTAITMSRTYNSLEQLMETVDAQSGKTRYAYDGAGNPAIIEDAANNQITAWYDALGRKAWVDDPNMGKTDFTYNAFGELEKETDANGESIYYDMDRVGRVTQRTGDNGAGAAFLWDTVTDGLLTSQSTGEHSTVYAYDSAARVTTTTVNVSDNVHNQSYVTETLYDAHYGRPVGMVYPDENGNADGLTVEYRYNNHGYLTQERNAQSLHVYRQITAQDALGNIKEALINNGDLAGDYLYHSATGQMLHAKIGVSVNNSLHHYQYGDILTGNGYDGFGNLTYQTNEISGVREDYEYDTLHRLTKSTLSGSNPNHSIDYGYDVVGNLKKKSDYSENQMSAYAYVAGTNKLQSVALKNGTDTVTYGYDAKGNQTTRNGIQEVTYNVFHKPTFIDKNNSEVRLSYGADLARYKQVRTENANGPETTTTTYYIGKHYEVEITDTTTTRKHYIPDVAIVSLPDTALAEIVYTHRDRLGSAVTMTDDHNQVVAERHFDPFGKPRKGKNWSLLESMGISATLANNEDDKVMATRRGFTDHEHLDQAELIHMNGRVYDYNVGRFMSVDPFIQAPGNSQSVNPYSYIMNNPLAGTDPTGYLAHDEMSKCSYDCRFQFDTDSGDTDSGGTDDNYNGTLTPSVNLVGVSDTTDTLSQGETNSESELSFLDSFEGKTEFQLVENFSTKTSNVQYWSDDSGRTFEHVTFTKNLDSLVAVEKGAESDSEGINVSSINYGVGVTGIATTLQNVSKADILYPSRKINVQAKFNPVITPVNIGIAKSPADVMVNVSNFTGQFAKWTGYLGLALSAADGISNIRNSTTVLDKSFAGAKLTLDLMAGITSIAAPLAFTGPPGVLLGVGIAAGYMAFDYFYGVENGLRDATGFRRREKNGNRTQ